MSTAIRISPARLSDIVGSEFVSSDPDHLTRYEVDGMQPAAVARPGTPEETAELVRLAAAEKLAIIPMGARTKLSIGMPPRRYDLAIDMTRLNRVVAYDPGDLTLGVEAGCKLAALQSALAEHSQILPLAVPYSNEATVGGTIATNADTPLRQCYGTARDYVLGMEFITGAGAQTKSGGRVVKNVTGYDIHKLMIGALGTLGIITRINFKTFPRPRQSRGFLASFRNAGGAFELRSRIARSPLSPLTVEILSPEVPEIYSRSPLVESIEAAPPPAAWFRAKEWSLTAAFGGATPVLERYARDLTRLAEESGATATRVLDDSERPLVWGRLRESIPILLRVSRMTTILKFSTLAGNLAALVEQISRISERNNLSSATILRGCGIAYLALLPGDEESAALPRLARAAADFFETASTGGCSATIPFCPLELKHTINIWGPPREDFALMRKLKPVFDPQGIFSPGRFVGEL